VVKPVNIAQLPSIPHDLLFLDRGNLVRWNHATRHFETLSGNQYLRQNQVKQEGLFE